MRELTGGARLLMPADYRRMRWKNGQGWTTEISVSPEDTELNGKPFDWRISMAEIESDGAFSAFSGYERTILVAEGAGMELHFDEAPMQRIGRPYVPFRFQGEWHTRCHLLNGPVRDFNVMTARARWRHDCQIVRGAADLRTHARTPDLIILHCLHGYTEIHSPAGWQVELRAQQTLMCSGSGAPGLRQPAAAGADTALAVVTLERTESV